MYLMISRIYKTTGYKIKSQRNLIFPIALTLTKQYHFSSLTFIFLPGSRIWFYELFLKLVFKHSSLFSSQIISVSIFKTQDWILLCWSSSEEKSLLCLLHPSNLTNPETHRLKWLDLSIRRSLPPLLFFHLISDLNKFCQKAERCLDEF